jgi:hypothetical protein
VGVDIRRKLLGAVSGQRRFWGDSGSSVDRPLCRLREVLLGTRPWVGRERSPRRSRGRLEEVAGPELGTVPDTRACASPSQPSALPSEATSLGPGILLLFHLYCSLTPAYLWPWGKKKNPCLSLRVEPKRW